MRKQPKGVPMSAEHIKRIVNGEKDLYIKVLHKNFEHEDAIKALLQRLKFKTPREPYSFWNKIYTWQDAVQKALPHSRPMRGGGMDCSECYYTCIENEGYNNQAYCKRQQSRCEKGEKDPDC